MKKRRVWSCVEGFGEERFLTEGWEEVGDFGDRENLGKRIWLRAISVERDLEGNNGFGRRVSRKGI